MTQLALGMVVPEDGTALTIHDEDDRLVGAVWDDLLSGVTERERQAFFMQSDEVRGLLLDMLQQGEKWPPPRRWAILFGPERG